MQKSPLLKSGAGVFALHFFKNKKCRTSLKKPGIAHHAMVSYFAVLMQCGWWGLRLFKANRAHACQVPFVVNFNRIGASHERKVGWLPIEA